MPGIQVLVDPAAATGDWPSLLFRLTDDRCGTYSHLGLAECEEGRPPKSTSTPIFSRLARAYADGHSDEASYLAAAIAARRLPEWALEEIRGPGIILYARTLAEAAILELGARVALCVAHGLDGAPKLGPREEMSYHVALAALCPNSRIHVISATATPPSFANSFSLDPTQPLSNDPPVGLIPNNQSLCYAASALTILLSLPQVSRALARPSVTGTPAELLRVYAHHLRTAALSDAEARELNRCLVKAPPFRRFDHGNSDDSREFALAILDLLSAHLPDTRALFGKGVYGIPSLKQHSPPPAPSNGPDTRIPYTVRREPVPGGARFSLINEPSLIPGLPSACKEGVYADRTGAILGTFSGIVEGALGGDRPDLLLLSHGIRCGESPEKFVIPIRLVLSDGTVYCMHGASMYDNVVTGGHYVALIISHTTMFFYDPQYDPSSEDMRLYRPRIIVYVRL